jgi:anti-sigma B factor antagonist
LGYIGVAVNSGIARHGQPKAAAAVTKIGAKCRVEATHVGGAIYLVLDGELDLSCMKRFRELLRSSIADPLEDLVIDLRAVTFIDSTGLVMLLRADTLAREEGFHLHVVRSPTEIVRAVFEVSGIDTLLPLCDEPPQLPG